MNKPEAFILLIPGYAMDEADTACLPFQQQFSAFLKKAKPGWEVFILAFQYPYHTVQYKLHGCTVIPFNGKSKGGIMRLLLRKKIESRISEIHSSYNIKGLLSFWLGECAMVGKRMAEKLNLTHYCWLMGQDARKGNKYVSRTGMEPKNLIVISDSQQAVFKSNYKTEPGHVIYPGINERLFEGNPTSRDIDIIGVGSLIPLKQYDIFIDVVAELKKSLPGIKAVLIGNGAEYDSLIKKSRKLNLENNLVFTGKLPYKEALKYMQRSKILLHPSSYEGFSGVCMEALYAGVHVVSFCRAVSEDIVQWHIADTKNEMASVAFALLNNTSIQFINIKISGIEEAVDKITALFN